MNLKSILNQQIRTYLIENPIDRMKQHPYAETAERFGVDKEIIRNIWRKLRHAGIVEKGQSYPEADRGKTWNYVESTTTAEVKKTTEKLIKNEEELIEECDIDTDKWEVSHWECKRYNAWIKNTDGEIEQKPLYSVYAKLRRRQIETDPELQKRVLVEELKSILMEGTVAIEPIEYTPEKQLLLEIAIFDPHFGKLSHADESGEDYDLKIAGERYRTAISDLLSKVNLDHVGRILFPVGNDLFNVDNINKTTTNFTPQDTDTRFHKMVGYVKRLLIETINRLSMIAPVDVVIVVGNHDTTVTYLCGEILDAFYHSNPNVNVENRPRLRKYYIFGKNSFLFTHGDREKQAELGLIFATEQPKIWGDSLYRFCQIGHYHHTKKINYISGNEFQGFQVQILPSLSPNDAWHSGRGYHALRQAKAFLYDEDEGLIAEITHTVR